MMKTTVSAETCIEVDHERGRNVVLLRVGGITFELTPSGADDLADELERHVRFARGWEEEPES